MKNYDESYLGVTAAAEISNRMRTGTMDQVVTECNNQGFKFKSMNKDRTKLKAQFLFKNQTRKIEIHNEGKETSVTYEIP